MESSKYKLYKCSFLSSRMLASSGILPELKETCEERIKYMLKNKVNLLDIIDVINYWDVDCINKLGPRIPTRYVDPNLANATNQGKSGVISRAVQTYLVGNPKILKGPKSTGKNTMIIFFIS